MAANLAAKQIYVYLSLCT